MDHTNVRIENMYNIKNNICINRCIFLEWKDECIKF